jgi:hypothetical protein
MSSIKMNHIRMEAVVPMSLNSEGMFLSLVRVSKDEYYLTIEFEGQEVSSVDIDSESFWAMNKWFIDDRRRDDA